MFKTESDFLGRVVGVIVGVLIGMLTFTSLAFLCRSSYRYSFVLLESNGLTLGGLILGVLMLLCFPVILFFVALILPIPFGQMLYRFIAKIPGPDNSWESYGVGLNSHTLKDIDSGKTYRVTEL